MTRRLYRPPVKTSEPDAEVTQPKVTQTPKPILKEKVKRKLTIEEIFKLREYRRLKRDNL